MDQNRYIGFFLAIVLLLSIFSTMSFVESSGVTLVSKNLTKYEGDVLPEKNDPEFSLYGQDGYGSSEVINGVLTIDDPNTGLPSERGSYRSYYRNDPLSESDYAVMEFKMKINRAMGYKTIMAYCSVTAGFDDGNKEVQLGFDETSLGFGPWDGPYIASASVDTKIYHTYKLVKNRDISALVYVDDKLVLNVAYDKLDDVNDTTPRQIFGAGSSGGRSNTDWDYVTYKITEVTEENKVSYEASVLPEKNDQPFTLYGMDGYGTSNISNGILTINDPNIGTPNDIWSYRTYYRNDPLTPQDNATLIFKLKVEKAVGYSTIMSYCSVAAGFLDGKKVVQLGINTTSLGFGPWNGPYTASATVNTTEWHIYKLIKIKDQNVLVYVDNKLVLNVSYSILENTSLSTPRQAFGAGSCGGTSITHWDYFRYSIGGDINASDDLIPLNKVNVTEVEYGGDVLPEKNSQPFKLYGKDGWGTSVITKDLLNINDPSIGTPNDKWSYRSYNRYDPLTTYDNATMEFRMKLSKAVGYKTIMAYCSVQAGFLDGSKVIQLSFDSGSMGFGVWNGPRTAEYKLNTTNWHEYKLVKNGNVSVQAYVDDKLVINISYDKLEDSFTNISRQGFGAGSSGGTSNSDWDYIKYTIENVVATVPTSPRTLTADADNTTISLQWKTPASDGGSPVTNYTIYRGNNADDFSYYSEIGNYTSFADSDVNGSKTYYYRVTAKNINGEGAYSNVAYTKLKSDETNTSYDYNNTFSAWGDIGPVEDPDEEIPEQELPEEVAPEQGPPADPGIETIVLKIDVPEPPGTDMKAPMAPQNVRKSMGNGYIELGWNSPVDGGGPPVTEYRIYRGIIPGEEVLVAIIEGDSTSYNDPEVGGGETYYYRIVAVNDAGEAETTITVTTSPDEFKADDDNDDDKVTGGEIFGSVQPMYLIGVILAIVVFIVILNIIVVRRRKVSSGVEEEPDSDEQPVDTDEEPEDYKVVELQTKKRGKGVKRSPSSQSPAKHKDEITVEWEEKK